MSHRCFITANFPSSRHAPLPFPRKRVCGGCGGCGCRSINFSNTNALEKVCDVHTHPPHIGERSSEQSEDESKEKNDRSRSCETFGARNASPHPFPKQETQSVPDHSQRKELVPTDQLQLISNSINKRRLSTWIFIPIRLHWIT